MAAKELMKMPRKELFNHLKKNIQFQKLLYIYFSFTTEFTIKESEEF